MTKEEYLLICLMEECAELQFAAAKFLRFGKGGNSTNNLIKEYIDVLSTAMLLQKLGVFTIDPHVFVNNLEEKQKKLTYYMEVSEELGILEGDR